MRKYEKISLVIFAISIIIGLSFWIDNGQQIAESNELNRNNLQISSQMELNPFIIDDTGGGTYTWAEAVLESWCSGSGTSNNPYIIENVLINGWTSTYCLIIRKSNVHFIIQNSIFMNSSSSTSGIRLSEIQNGELANVSCIYNKGTGMSIVFSNNITISENTIKNSRKKGIIIDNCADVSLINNTIKQNSEYKTWITNSINITLYNTFSDGLRIEDSSIIEITSSTITSLVSGPWTGVLLDNSHKCSILNSEINRGMNLIDSHNNTISDSTIAGGIRLETSDSNYISNNTASRGGGTGIDVYHCEKNTIFQNYVTGSTYGIHISGSHFTNVSENIVTLNNEGILVSSTYYVHMCDNNSISKNLCYDNSVGIRLKTIPEYRLSGNNVTENVLRNNTIGIEMYLTNENNVFKSNLMYGCGIRLNYGYHHFSPDLLDSSNLVNGGPVYYLINQTGLDSNSYSDAGQLILGNCSDAFIHDLNLSNSSYGIYIFDVTNITILNVNSSYNQIGFTLWDSNNITLKNIVANKNEYLGITLYNCSLTDIIENTINNNEHGIFISSCFFTNISKNTVDHLGIFSYNLTGTGILVDNCSYTTISRNNISYGQIGIETAWGDVYNITITFNKITCMSYEYIWIRSTIYGKYEEGNEFIDCPQDDDGNGDGDIPENGIPFGNYFILMFFSSVALIIIITKRKTYKK